MTENTVQGTVGGTGQGPVTAQEEAVYKRLWEVMSTVPHRRLGPAVAGFREVIDRDPSFGVKAATHLLKVGQIRDQKVAAVAALLGASPNMNTLREVGRVLALGSNRAGGVYDVVAVGPGQPGHGAEPHWYPGGLPPRQLFQALEYMTRPWVVMGPESPGSQPVEMGRGRTRTSAEKLISKLVGQASAKLAAVHNRARPGLFGRVGRRAQTAETPQVNVLRFSVHLDESHVKAPRLVKTIFLDYLGAIEGDRNRADGLCSTHGKALKSLWKYWHLSPAQYPMVHSLLFSKEPPRWSRRAAFADLRDTEDPREWLRIANEHRLDSRVLATILPNTPAAKMVIIDRMTPTQALNARGWVESSGLLDVPEVREAYEDKIAKASRSVASIRHRRSARGVDAGDAGVQAAVDKAEQKAIDAGGRIRRSVLLLVDKSASMDVGIDLSREIASVIGAKMDPDLLQPDENLDNRPRGMMVVAFNNYADEVVVPAEHTAKAWRDAFQLIYPGGGTNPSAGLRWALNKGYRPDEVVLVSDGGENSGNFANVLNSLTDPPHLTYIRVQGDPGLVATRLDRARVEHDRFDFTGRQPEIIDNLVAILSGEPKKSLVQTILETPLYVRGPANA